MLTDQIDWANPEGDQVRIDISRPLPLSGLPKEPMGKSKRVKRPAKKSTQDTTRGVVIRETPEMPVSKKKEMVDVARGVPDVTEEEPSESETESWGNDEDDSNNDQDSRSKGSDQEKDKEEEEIVKTPSNDSDDEDETKIADKTEGEEMDYTTSLLYDDVDIRLNEPVDTDKGFVQEQGTNALQ
ncbi:hypothetical protein Tco_1198991 [Tanacetum coccineum]